MPGSQFFPIQRTGLYYFAYPFNFFIPQQSYSDIADYWSVRRSIAREVIDHSLAHALVG